MQLNLFLWTTNAPPTKKKKNKREKEYNINTHHKTSPRKL